MAFDWFKSLRHNNLRRRSNLQLATPAPLEPRRLLSSVPIGPEFKVNSYTSDWQSNPSIAIDGDGDFVVAWHGYAQDGSGSNIYAQRFNALGVSQSAEFLVNSTTSEWQNNPAVAIDADGDFVITWEGYAQDGSAYGIYAQRYNSMGVPQGSEFQVNTHTTNIQNVPDIAMDASGDFVITWQSYQQDGSGYGIYAQRYDATGTPQGSEFRVNSHTSDWQNDPSIAMDASGDFVVVWHSSGQDGSDEGIYAQRYDAAGMPQGSEFLVNSYTDGVQRHAAVAMDFDGDFVIAWESYLQDGWGEGIYAQRFNSLGTPQGSEFQVHTHTSNRQTAPAVSLSADGDFVISWESYEQDGSSFGIYARQFNAQGVPQGTEFRANTFTSSWQLAPSIGMDADGDFVITWYSYEQDGSDNGIYAQRYHAGQVDGLGVSRSAKFYLDSNHSNIWDGSSIDTLNTFGNSTDTPLVGDWNGDGYDEIGVWRAGTFYLDANGNGIWDGPATDKQFVFGNPSDSPVVGDWNNDGKVDIGVWRAGKFYLDLNGNYSWNAGVDAYFSFGSSTDMPVIGDWNGDGTDDVGVWRAGKFYLDLNGNRVWNFGVDGIFSFGNTTDRPIVGDWNGDGIDDIGVWRAGKFYRDSDGNRSWNVGLDSVIGFGATTDMPLIGYWRPKTIPASSPTPAELAGTLTVNNTPLPTSASTPEPDGEMIASLIAVPVKRRNP